MTEDRAQQAGEPLCANSSVVSTRGKLLATPQEHRPTWPRLIRRRLAVWMGRRPATTVLARL
eukprot:15086056-Alexandrium_andersonii.AAC.1